MRKRITICKPPKRQRLEYTPLDKPMGCIVTTIEIVTPIAEIGNLSETLDVLRQYNAATVVDQIHIADSFEVASKILDSREVDPATVIGWGC